MSYSDGLMVVGHNVAAKTINAAAADFDTFDLAVPATLLGAFIVATADFGDAVTAGLVASVDVTAKDGGARTEVLTIPVDVATIKFGNGSKAAAGAAPANYTAIDAGDIVASRSTALPKKLNAGDRLHLEHKVAATGGTPAGSYKLVVLLRVDGYDLQSTNILS